MADEALTEEQGGVDARSPYSATFSFQNNLGGTIDDGWAKHWTSDYGTQQIDLAGLANGATSSTMGFMTSTSNTDHWAFQAMVGGTIYGVNDKSCGVEPIDANQNVQLAAFLQSSLFVIGTPESASCQTEFDQP